MRPHLFDLGPQRLLLVASTGGHLAQLVRIAEAQGASEDSIWVTFDSPQSRSALAGKRVIWVDYVAPRDLRGMLRALRTIGREVRASDIDGVLSTGAAVGIAGFLWGKRHRVPTVYVESVSRTHGPSVTGKITHALRLAKTYTQHSEWATKRWQPIPSVMRRYERAMAPQSAGAPIQAERRSETGDTGALRILVTLGTIRPYRFDRLVERVLSITGPDDHVVWQLGVTTRSGLPGECHDLLDGDVFLQEAHRADVVITHAGVGTILNLLDHGISPVVVPRRKEFGEHIDDHQLQIWNLLREADVAVPRAVEDVTREALLESANSMTLAKADD